MSCCGSSGDAANKQLCTSIQLASLSNDDDHQELQQLPSSQQQHQRAGVSIIIVDTLEVCTAACSYLSQQPEIAVDLEGDNLGRTGKISLVQIATPSSEGPPALESGGTNNKVFIFDVIALGVPTALRDLLSNNNAAGSPRKLMFDCRSDADALSHQFQTEIANVFDMQVFYTIFVCGNVAQFLSSMDKAMETLLEPSEFQRAEAVKTIGKKQFASHLGGLSSAWMKRPLGPELIEDVTMLLRMRKAWATTPERDAVVMSISSSRMQATVHRPACRVATGTEFTVDLDRLDRT